jgi:hypothetical protein
VSTEAGQFHLAYTGALTLSDIPIDLDPLASYSEAMEGEAKSHDLLAVPRRPGPGYSQELSREQISNRYQQCSEILATSLSVLAGSSTFKATVEQLRASGWRDWHILTALLNASINYRFGDEMQRTPPQELLSLRQKFLHPEVNGQALPDEWVTVESLKEMRLLALPSVAGSWHLHIKHHLIDPMAIEALLAARFGYWTDDVEHTDPFAAD